MVQERDNRIHDMETHLHAKDDVIAQLNARLSAMSLELQEERKMRKQWEKIAEELTVKLSVCEDRVTQMEDCLKKQVRTQLPLTMRWLLTLRAAYILDFTGLPPPGLRQLIKLCERCNIGSPHLFRVRKERGLGWEDYLLMTLVHLKLGIILSLFVP